MKIKVIPAIDLIDGKCVRLKQGDYTQKTIYNEDPLEVARMFEDAGIKYLHLVDLDGAKAKKPVNLAILENICKHTSLCVDFGGGVQTNEAISDVFNAGAQQITAGSIAFRQPDMVVEWLEKYGSEKIILGADAKNGLIAIAGWEESTAAPVKDFVTTWVKKGIQYTISTDVAKDGLLAGPSLDLYQELQTIENLSVIASGGVSCIDDIYALDHMGVYGVIVGKAIYEKRIMLKDLV